MSFFLYSSLIILKSLISFCSLLNIFIILGLYTAFIVLEIKFSCKSIFLLTIGFVIFKYTTDIIDIITIIIPIIELTIILMFNSSYIENNNINIESTIKLYLLVTKSTK